MTSTAVPQGIIGDELTLHSGNISGVAKVTKRATQSTANEVSL